VFSLSEVRLGIAPAMISPYVLRAIGPRQARRLCLTGERFGAATAARVGLLHEAVAAQALDAAVARILSDLLQGAPGAQAEIKELLAHVSGRDEVADERLAGSTAKWIARLRASPEGREGLTAFLEKRPPDWARTQRHTGSLRMPAEITRSGHGGTRGVECWRRIPRRSLPRNRLVRNSLLR
jgi:methylglutaconyl-CoA hydratase